MARSDRLFEIIQILRSARAVLPGWRLAAQLGISTRTLYRDIAALQAMRVPIEGEPGLGYLMRAGYDLPPLNFDRQEIEAILVGLSLLGRTGDPGLQAAAESVRRKVMSKPVETDPADSDPIDGAALRVSVWGIRESGNLRPLRDAIREERKLSLTYRDGEGAQTCRVILPIALTYYIEVAVLSSWCELREDFRHFRADRIVACRILEEDFRGRSDALRLMMDEAREASPPKGL